MSKYPHGSIGEQHELLVEASRKAYDNARESLDAMALYSATYDMHRILTLIEKASKAQDALLAYRKAMKDALKLDDAKSLDEPSRRIADLIDALIVVREYLSVQ